MENSTKDTNMVGQPFEVDLGDIAPLVDDIEGPVNDNVVGPFESREAAIQDGIHEATNENHNS